ncbi:transglycosylase SLT domain-containing protein [Candidatus Pacearchaeota archaeon]|nr:transglycosylase SLT domain-containing protein [Candidatus Pacearchaeota archaeon]
MTTNKKIKFGMFLLIGILLIVSISAYSRSTTQYNPPTSSSNYLNKQGISLTRSFSEDACQAGQDFVVQISPLGCTPTVVRSDLLEEQNVPVFCQLVATNINPLIDVEAIDSISFKGDYPKEVSGVGFHPANAGIKTSQSTLLNSPVLNNIGYVVIVLKKQPNESAMPDWVQGNMTARIKYDVKNAFGIGKAVYYLPQMSDEDWDLKYKQYGFWKGKGFLKADYIDKDSARISIYKDKNNKLTSVSLTKGKTSGKINIPGFYCLASLQLRLDGLVVPDTRAKFEIEGEVVEVIKGEKFLDNKCSIKTKPEKKGLYQKAKIYCRTDSGGKDFTFQIAPKVRLSVDGDEKNYELGQKIKDKIYVGYIGAKKLSGGGEVIDTIKQEDLIVYFYKSEINLEELSDSKLSWIARSVEHKLSNVKDLKNAPDIKKEEIEGIKYGEEKTIFGEDVTFIGFAGAQDEDFGEEGRFDNELQNEYGGVVNVKYKVLIELVDGQWEIDTGLTEGEITNNQIDSYTKFLDAYNYVPKTYLTPNNELVLVKDSLVVDVYNENGNSLKKYEEKISDGLKLNYENAIKTYDEIIDSYSSLEKTDEQLEDVSYGEVALYEKIKLAEEVEQKASAAVFCEEFKQRYPESGYLSKVEDICDEYALANSESASWNILVNGVANSIRFEGVYEPSEKEYSAEVSIGDKDYVLTKNEIVEPEDESSKDDSGEPEFFVQLISLNDDYAKVQVNYKDEDGKPRYKIFKLKEDVVESFWEDNKIVLTEINLKKQAKVSVIPSIDNVGTEADFTFKIGIEKRAIQLSPEKTMEKIKNLNETIEKWEKISDNLGNVVKGMKVACLGTSAYLTVKNLFSGFSGKAAARHEVTGWYRDKCKAEGVEGTKEMQKCLLGYNDKINEGVEALAEVNTNRERLNDKISYKDGKLENADEFLKNLPKSFQSEDGKIDISKEEMEAIKKNLGTQDYNQYVKDLNYYWDMKSKKGIFDDKADKNIEEIWKRLDKDYQLNNVGKSLYSELEWDAQDVTVGASKDVKEFGVSNFRTVAEAKNKFSGIDGKYDKYYVRPYVDDIGGKSYLLIVDKNGIVQKTYEYGNKDSDGKISLTDTGQTNKFKVRFKLFDKTSYNNKYEEPKVIYYEIGADKGRPAIVPVDVDKGFYAATTSGSSGMSSYDASGMPSYFYLCNVMENGKQEFNQGRDDECVGVRVGSNKADGALTGLSEEKTNEWARKSISALRDASREYGAGVRKVTIRGKKILVGNPAMSLPGTQCEDFMSPEDCALMFNVCDPVVCPESRCDFGGRYRVSNVVQSGIIGGVLLCLPNFGSPAEGGVVIPVCLTGIHAGIDSLVSIYKNYGDCLQHSLDTGETVAICDEIHSIYLCEFFWKQAIPFMDLIIPKTIEFILTRGGGEYLNVQAAWANAGKSVDYMTNYYGANAYAAFKVRSTDEVGTAFCKNFISARYPASGDFFDALIEPDSPSQYHGWFHETTFTTATVPPTSQYKVFYHIYAGKDAGVYYSVYLKSPEGSSFYTDASQVSVASGYIEKGGYASETKDFIDVSGYQEMCINVQGQEQCGFKDVSTSFALDYLNKKYVKDQAKRTDIKSEKECISGSASVYSMLTPNVQAGTERVIEPKIYDQGIVRVCATSNPGEATDKTRWAEVGTCGGNIKCWLDTDSVKDAVVFDESLKGLEKVTEDALEKLRREGDYLSAAEFDNLIDDIKKADNEKKIILINDALNEKSEKKVFFDREKVQLLFLKAKAYAGLVLAEIMGEKGVESEKPKIQGDVDEKEDEEEGDDVKKESEKTCGDCKPEFGFFCDEEECEEFGVEIGKECHKELIIKCVEKEVEEDEEKTFSELEKVEIEDREDKTYDFKNDRTKVNIIKIMNKAKTESFGDRLCNCENDSGSYADLVIKASQKYNIPDPLLLLSVMMQESSCEAEAELGSSIGLMGISSWEMCEDELSLGSNEDVKGKRNVANNINCGAFVLKQKHKEKGTFYSAGSDQKYNSCSRNYNTIYYNWEAALRGYNGWGCGNDDYVEEVMQRFEELSKSLD